MKTKIAAFFLFAFILASCAQATDLPRPENPVPEFRWDPWKAAISPDGTIQNLFISYNEREEMDILMKLGENLEEWRRKKHGIKPNNWKVISCFVTDIDMVFVDEDGTRFHEKGGMSTEDIEWMRKNYQQYEDAAYAFSRGTVKINPVERYMSEPLMGEYSNAISFWLCAWPDLGIGLNVYDFDSVTGIWYEGPCRAYSRGVYGVGNNWIKRLGRSNAQFAVGREIGGSIGDMSKITRHEWGHGVSSFIRKCGYIGLPTQYTPGNFHHGSHLFLFRSILTPAHWRRMRMQGPMNSPANRPNDRFLGFCDTWLANGPFDLPDNKRSTESGIPHPAALDQEFITPEVLPEKDMETSGGKWIDLTNDWKRNGPVIRSAFPSPHVDTLIYVHTYVYSSNERQAILWAGCTQPTQVFLNGTPALRFWRGGFEDGAARKVILRKGWNRVMYKILDQGERGMGITLRFTDLKHHVMADLRFSGQKPEGEIVETAAPLPPLEIKKFSWEWPVNDDWYGQLPILTEEHFDKILGVKGVRILGAPTKWSDRALLWHERRWSLIDLSNIKGETKILSRVMPWDSLKTTLENTMTLDNHLVMSRELGNGQRSYESMGLIRYKKPDGKTGDIVFLRADVVEMFLNTARRPKGTPKDFHKKNIVGYILRDTKNYIVLDTDLGSGLPVNELDMLTAADGGMELEASPDVSRVLRGNPASLNLTVRWTGDNPVTAKATIKRFDTDEVILEKDLGEIAPGSVHAVSQPLDTSRLDGLINFIASVEFGDGQIIEKPVPLPVFDPVNVTVRVEGSGILQVPKQIVRVTLSNNQATAVSGTLSLDLPEGWEVEPASTGFDLPAIDTTADATFEVTIPRTAEKGWSEIGASASVKDVETVSKGSLPVMVSMDDVLVKADFEDGIAGSFSFVNGMYNVKADVAGPKNGQRSLHVYDRGGSHFGHVCMFGPGERPAPIPAGIDYAYDTKLYPWVEFWLKTDARDSNLGLQIVLDDGDYGYGILINGFWEQQWDPRKPVGRVEGFAADGEWHLVRINLDEILDRALGNTSHFVKELQFGDTRGFASGWSWSFDYNHHYIDDFRIFREKTPKEFLHVEKTAEGFSRYSKTHRIPAFPSKSENGLRLTLGTNRIEYNQWREKKLQIWATNTSNETISIAVEPWQSFLQVRITDEGGNVLGGEWAYFIPADEKQEEEFDTATVKFRDLKPGENFSRTFKLKDLTGKWMETRKIKFDDGKKYVFEVKTVYKRPEKSDETEEPANLVRETGISNAKTISLAQVPTLEEELDALKNSPSVVRRARSAAQLGKAKYEPAITALAAALKDLDDNVRLNAVWALGNMPRFDPDDAAQETYRQKMAPAIEALRKSLDDENRRVGEYAAQALANLNARGKLGDIIARAKSESAWIRRKTADALKTMGDPAAIKILTTLMDDESRSARQAALGALIEFANRHIEAAKNADDPKNASAKEVFNTAWSGIRKGLDDEYFVIRRDVVKNCIKYQPLVNAKEIAAKALEDPDDWVREAGILALPELEDLSPETAERLVDFFDDYWDNIRKAALEVYPKISGKSVEEKTGLTFGDWMRKYPRPGESWKKQ